MKLKVYTNLSQKIKNYDILKTCNAALGIEINILSSAHIKWSN